MEYSTSLTSCKFWSGFCADGLLFFAVPMKAPMPMTTTTKKNPVTTNNAVFLFLNFGGVATDGMNSCVSSWQCGHEIIFPATSTGKLMCPLQC